MMGDNKRLMDGLALGGDQKRFREEMLAAIDPSQLPGLEAEYYVEQHLVGWLIGRSGATLREVETSFGVKVSMDQSSKDQGFSKMCISGEATSVQAAAEHMNASLARAATGLGGGKSADGALGPFLLDAPPSASCDSMCEEVHVEQQYVGWLLGKSGGVMREVETSSGTRIDIKQDTKHLGYSRAIIHGKADQRSHAKQLITESIERAGASGPPKRGGCAPSASMAFGGCGAAVGGGSALEIQVEQKWVGWLLGKGGGVVREIEQESGAVLKIDQTTKQLGYSTIMVQGDSSQVSAASAAVSRSLAKVGGSPMVGNLGGVGVTAGGCGAPTASMAFGGSAPTASMAFGGSAPTASMAFGGSASTAPLGGGGSASSQLQIDQQWIGWLVGRGGGVVKEIEAATGAQISLNQETKPLGFSIATVKGDATAVQNAQNMIADKVQRISGGSGVSLVSDASVGNSSGAFGVGAASIGASEFDLQLAVEKIAAISGDPALTAQLKNLLNARTGGVQQQAMPAIAQGPQQFVELQLEQHYVGWLLGSRGKTVRDIEAQTTCKIGIDQSTKDLGYSVLKLTGTSEACQKAQERIEASLALAAPPGQVPGEDDGSSADDTMQVEQPKVGWLLGKAGMVLKEIETNSGAKISIDQSTRDMGFSTVKIRGGEQECQTARQLISDKVQQAGPMR
eukprot:TRINITY_DN8728_c0_g2_i2.p1 TRINITY_DN8728_c0_g2~~TRINITY_DN8728_c0_g2_i2.p1  ORF type:complete len:682 (-),score=148.76 TRINITY_DN8728_c0_g2_i2:67-2112(-)